MCGIVGGLLIQEEKNIKYRMEKALEAMRVRGPNDHGFEVSSTGNGVMALGHTRLSIIDLSSGGHQPMHSSDKRYSIVFNGEIYNYKELRKILIEEGASFISSSDTEVLLAAWIAWGVGCLRRLEGMFAFVVYDRHEKKLSCVRDAFGIKPFFYSKRNRNFFFASTQSALLEIRNNKPEINWQASYDYLVHGDYDSSEKTFINEVSQLPPGHFIEVDLNSGAVGHPIRWWMPPVQQESNLSFHDAAELVRERFLHNVRQHLISDVPVGAALSGGIDSSAVVCAMRHVEPDADIRTFSYIASGTPYSEERWVDQVNAHVKAESFKITAGPTDLQKDLDSMILAQDEPFGSTSIYAQYLVFKKAKESGITVTLDGQGADELLAGYSGYPGHRVLSLIEGQGVFSAHNFLKQWSKWPDREYKKGLAELGRIALPDYFYAKLRKIMGRDFRPLWLDSNMLSDAGVNFFENRPVREDRNKGRRVIEQLGHSLQQRGLPALLRHADRNSMNFSIESRVPFLTPQFAEILLKLPEEFLISKDGETKSVFREAMRGIVPDDILFRKDKIGFATPEKDWLLALAPSVRGWFMEDNPLTPFINRENLLKAFDEIVSGKRNFSWQLWRWINFVRWSEIYMKK